MPPIVPVYVGVSLLGVYQQNLAIHALLEPGIGQNPESRFIPKKHVLTVHCFRLNYHAATVNISFDFPVMELRLSCQIHSHTTHFVQSPERPFI